MHQKRNSKINQKPNNQHQNQKKPIASNRFHIEVQRVAPNIINYVVFDKDFFSENLYTTKNNHSAKPEHIASISSNNLRSINWKLEIDIENENYMVKLIDYIDKYSNIITELVNKKSRM